MSEKLCSCCPHLSPRSGKLDSFYRENFVPRSWRLSYRTLSKGMKLYLTGNCANCRENLEEQISLPDGLSGDMLLSAVYDAMWAAPLYDCDEKMPDGNYYGPCPLRSRFYNDRDRWGTFLREQEFLRLFHDYDRTQVRLWLEKMHPRRSHKRVLRDTGGSLFYTLLKLAEENGDFEKARPILDYGTPEERERCLAHSGGKELTNYEFDFVPIVRYDNEDIRLDCCLQGQFDETGRYSLRVGTLKALGHSLESVKIMAELGGALLYHADQYVKQNIHRYTPQTVLNRESERMRGK